MAETRLTEDEREALADACDAGMFAEDTWIRFIRNGMEDMLVPCVESILTARLARVEALAPFPTCENYTGSMTCAGDASRTPDAKYGVHSYCWPCRIRTALAPTQPVSEPSDG